MTMNIKEGGELASHETGPFAECIKEYDPDVISVQEVDNMTIRNGGKDWLSELAADLGMFQFYGKSFTYQDGGFGVGVLCKYPFYKADKVVSYPSGAREPRATAWVYLELPDGNILRIAATHLAVESDQIRVSNIADINNKMFIDDSTPTLLMGDFNADPDSETLQYAMFKWQDIGKGTGDTYPSGTPASRIDYVMGYPKTWKATSYEIVNRPDLSDHCFVVADLEFEY
jgi:endonuclease/exonuclease/phosphatase family metal-dependent hydrolase